MNFNLNKVFSKCGMRCDLCLIYRPNVEREDRREEICAVYRKTLPGYDPDPKTIICDGCSCEKDNSILFVSSCKTRKCVIDKGYTHCGYCESYPCDVFPAEPSREELVRKIDIEKLWTWEDEKLMEAYNCKKNMNEFRKLKRAEDIINKSTIHTCGDTGCTADWVMSLIDENGYPNASMITAAKADGFKWIAFCTAKGWNKANRAEKNPRACIYLFDKESFTGISLVGKIEVITDTELNNQLWYDDLGAFFTDSKDDRLCVLMFKPERYNIFIDGSSIYGEF